MAGRGQGKYVRVLYDYEYKSSGKHISIKEGDRCLLLKKTNSEWWSVIKLGEKKPIYVPANYVVELEDGKKRKGKGTLQKHGSVEDVADDEKSRSSSEDLLQGDDNAFQNGSGSCDTSEHDSDSVRCKLTASEDSLDRIVDVDEERGPDSGGRVKNMVDRYEAPEYANLETIQAEINKKQSKKDGGDQEYANIAHIQAAFRSPPPKPEKACEPLRQFAQDWEMYLDSDTGRNYYHNVTSGESTWKPPRGLRAKDSGSPVPKPPAPAVPEKPPPSPGGRGAKGQSVPHATQVPRGWSEEKTDDGVSYVNEVTSEKSPSALLDEERRDQRSPKLKPVELPSVPDLVLLPAPEGASGPVSPEVVDSPLSPPFSPTTPTESPCGSLKRPGHEERKDTLNRTKLTENGKKVKKNWCPSYVVLQGSTLYFYKDQKASLPKQSAPSGKPDEVIDLHGASIELNNKDKTSRKNSIVVTLLSGTQWLLQADDSQKIQKWYGTLAHNLAQMPQLIVSRGSQESLNRSSDSLEQLDDSPESAARIKRKKSRKEKDKDKGAAPLTDKEKTNTLDDPNLTFPEKSSKIKDRLRNFFGQRPEKKTLQAKGIIKETVFGALLQHLSEREKCLVPRFIQQVIVCIEEKGLAVDGIYRVSGNLSQIMKLRFMVDHNEKYDFDNPDWDIHVLTGSLKLFFRELMEPLIPYKQFEMLLTGIKLHDKAGKLKAFKDAIKCLPKPNRETIRVLFKHLNQVIELSRENRMQTQNVAIVFGPTLMWPERETQNVAVTTVYQSQIVEFILLEYKNLF